MTRVLFAVDGSNFARHAMQQAMGLIRADAETTLVTVVDPSVSTPPAPAAAIDVAPVIIEPLPVDAMASRIQGAEAQLTETAQRLGLSTDATMVVTGDPGPTLCRLADEGNFDLLVVGSHGSGFLKRVLAGSVSHHLLRHAPCPLLVVPHPHTRGE